MCDLVPCMLFRKDLFMCVAEVPGVTPLATMQSLPPSLFPAHAVRHDVREPGAGRRSAGRTALGGGVLLVQRLCQPQQFAINRCKCEIYLLVLNACAVLPSLLCACV